MFPYLQLDEEIQPPISFLGSFMLTLNKYDNETNHNSGPHLVASWATLSRSKYHLAQRFYISRQKIRPIVSYTLLPVDGTLLVDF